MTGKHASVFTVRYAERVISSAVELPDGKILVGGRFNRYGGWPAPCLVRLLPDGTVDASFRPGFSPPLGFVDYGQPEARLHFEDGKLYAAGTFASPEEAFPRALWRSASPEDLRRGCRSR